ncbi:hypothetical protein GCM10017559_42600 [Streptosporangium longisporum]|uniref:Uncharacterized protein n=1 Tax=Streptosporangium longisporum TaxID=46187 RepID=A0ABN3Y2L1_9ACTN
MVEDLSFSVRAGRVTGFLGPNGAGNTTPARPTGPVRSTVPVARAGFGHLMASECRSGRRGVLRAVAGAGLYLALQALFALAIGALLRHTAAAITCVLALVLVVPNLLLMLPGETGRTIHSLFPTVVGWAILAGDARQVVFLSPWAGLGVLALWTAALLAPAACLLRRRDA